jgi:hypothetical protein
MKSFSTLTLILVIALIIGACGAEAPLPATLSVVDMQNTAAAVAQTMIAQTQAAIPTATPIPPTETPTNTPLPTNTFPPVPSPAGTLTQAPSGSSGGEGECTVRPMPEVLQGEKVKIRINNSTQATMRLSVYLNDPKQCGYRAYNLEPGGALVLTDLVEGCYTLFAWNVDPDNYFIVTNGTSCVDSSYQVAFDISTRDIRQR